MYILVHYSEIALKRGNRKFFEDKLIQNCAQHLKPFSCTIRKLPGRILIQISGKPSWEKIKERLAKVFGIANFSQAFQWKGHDISDLGDTIAKTFHASGFRFHGDSFKVQTSRADKTYSLTSGQINEILGELLKNTLHKRVNLTKPDNTVFVEILSRDTAWYFFEKISGPGGLPTGTAGKVVSLLSGGIDSPVASWKIMRRGARVHFLHFHSYPDTSKASQHIVKDITKLLCQWQMGGSLTLISLLPIQRAIIAQSLPKLRLILYRRAMVHIANLVASRNGSLGLVTGDALGQVASQTLENMHVVSQASRFPLFRPLISYDKEEIIALAKQLGTYEYSTQPYEDCCSFLVPSHPETRARMDLVLKEESNISLEPLYKESLNKAEIIHFK